MILPRVSIAPLTNFGKSQIGAIFFSGLAKPHVASSTNPCVRWASKKASSSKRNTGGKSPGKRLGPKKYHDQYVYENQILVKHKMNFRFYPGQFVKTGRDKTLMAQVAGRVRFSKERWHPSVKTPFGKYIAPSLSDQEMERTFVHIDPEEEVGRFRLVEQI